MEMMPGLNEKNLVNQKCIVNNVACVDCIRWYLFWFITLTEVLM